MRIRLRAGVMLAILLFAPMLMTAEPVSACSPDDGFDPVGTSDVIVAGWLTGWLLLPKQDSTAFTPVHVTMTVQRVYKGAASTTLTFIDERTYIEPQTSTASPWAGNAGACGTFTSDPTGKYAVLGFVRGSDGNLRASGPRTFYLDGDGVGAGEWHERARQRLAALGPGRLPRTGVTPADQDPPPAVIPTALGISTLVVAGAILVIPHRKRSERGNQS